MILCQENKKDVEEIDARYLKGLKIIYVARMEEALQLALEKKPVDRKKQSRLVAAPSRTS